MKKIQELKNWLLEINLTAIEDKIWAGTASEQDLETYDRMVKYEDKGYW